MKTRTRKRLILITLLIVVASTLSLTGAALAQSSANYDLGCWGVFTAGGGEAKTAGTTLNSSFGQWVGRENTGANSILRSGYVQNWNPEETVGPIPDPPNGAFILYLPLIAKTVRVVRTCS